MSRPTPNPSAFEADAYEIDPVVELLGGGRVVGYRVVLGAACGGALAGLLLSQFWHWSTLDTARVRDGWFWARQPEITAATALTRSETETARRRLVGLNLLAEDHREDNILWFHINKDVLYRRLLAYSQEQGNKRARVSPANRNVETQQTGMRGPRKPECEDHANRNVESGEILHTEISPETSSERGSAPEPASPPPSSTSQSKRQTSRTFPPTEPHASQSVSHLLWRVEMALGGLLPAPAMGREAKAARALLDAGYTEEVILKHFLEQSARKQTGYSLHFLQTDLPSLAARRGAYSAEIASALTSLADEEGWEPEPTQPPTPNERSRE